MRREKNGAYVLRLIRDGEVRTFGSLLNYLGLMPKPRKSLRGSAAAIDTADITDTLFKLKEAGLIEINAVQGDLSRLEYSSGLRATPLLEKVEIGLQLSLRALGSGEPGNRLIISPLYEISRAGRYQSDIFVLMPFSPDLTAFYRNHLRSVAKALQMTITRADEFFTNAHVMFDVFSGIVRAKILIADCTGKNPNVFYEIGLAHALGKAVVLITQNPEDVPFDLRDRRCIGYDLTPRGMKAFKKRLTQTLKGILEDTEEPAHEPLTF